MKTKNKAVPGNDLEAAVKFVQVKLNPELYGVLASLADESQIPMGEYLVRLVAEKARRPDLAFVPRKRMGRPREKAKVPA